LKRADAIVGFLYIGTPASPLAPISEPDLSGFVRSWP
jgi:hypothetical protein